MVDVFAPCKSANISDQGPSFPKNWLLEHLLHTTVLRHFTVKIFKLSYSSSTPPHSAQPYSVSEFLGPVNTIHPGVSHFLIAHIQRMVN